ncbi:MAG TPA: hypothetical protein DCG49_01895 [Ruminococcus sp.]|nr:hypothetical protein [Ruminococcus sp.]
MTRQWRWNSKSNRAYLHVGIGMQDAVGAPQPSEAIPLQEGLRLLVSKGIDRIWAVVLITAFLRLITRDSRKRRRLNRKRRRLSKS